MSKVATALRGVGQTFITAGVVILLFVVYELYFTGLETAREQSQLRTEIEDLWQHGGGSYEAVVDPAKPPAKIPLGSGIAVLRIPRFGRDWGKVVLEGVSVSDLKRGPGHYPGTQLPGQIGNFVVSGHRTTYGAPFNRIDELKQGDAIVVETRDTWYTYRVSRTEIVPPSAVDVTYPVPHKRDEKATIARITLTSCHPKYSARQRIIVFGQLAETQPKSAGTPPALAAA